MLSLLYFLCWRYMKVLISSPLQQTTFHLQPRSLVYHRCNGCPASAEWGGAVGPRDKGEMFARLTWRRAMPEGGVASVLLAPAHSWGQGAQPLHLWWDLCDHWDLGQSLSTLDQQLNNNNVVRLAYLVTVNHFRSWRFL